MTELDGQGNWVHTNVYANGALIATYDNDNLGVHFRLIDWLGTLRVQTKYDGTLELTCASLPFGDTSTPCVSSTEHFFTGKERDSESGLDYFGARYYGSSMGRFMSPDEPFVDQSPGDPQSWNLYSYVRNNPLSNVDPDGQDCVTNNGDGTATINSGDCSGKDSNNEYYYNCDGCLMGTTSANLTSDGGLALYNANSNTISTISGYGYTAGSTGGFDPGSLAAGVFGAQSASTWNNAAGVVNAAGSIEMGIMAPWAAAGAGCLSGDSGGKCAANMALSVLPEVGELRAGATLLKEAAVAGKGAEILQKAGGAAQAVKEFEAIPAVSEQIDGAVRVKTLSDGSKAVLYESSSGSGTTISLQDASGHTNTKIRY